MSFHELLTSLEKLTEKEKAFVILFMSHKTGNKDQDLKNYMFDLESGNFGNETKIKSLFDSLYELDDNYIKKLQRKYRI